MSISCPYCHASAGFGHELGHRSSCPIVRKKLECQSCGSRDYPYHKDCCDEGIIAEWKVVE